MDVQQIINELQAKFGGNLDIAQITKALNGMDLKNMQLGDIISKLTQGGLIGDLDGDGKVESLQDELIGKAKNVLGSLFGK
ncbi:MAG: hypothetical protein HUK00_07845 [Bacteroidaceae bacterium]|nr:hypothetical protein [Bacteroidaceae bacterium]